MIRKILWIVLALLSVVIGFYPVIYFLIDRNFGLLSYKNHELLINLYWNIAFYTHITLGGLALLIGWIQFSDKIRINTIALHRTIGKIYVAAVLLSSLGGIYIGFFATGGLIASLGFICLGCVWFYTTLFAYLNIRNKKIEHHRIMMTYSYSACFAAVTLRLWLPLLIAFIGDFITAYKIAAWLCWIPNLTIAYFITRRLPISKA